jgi:gliding motility-associated-like protein
VRALILRNQRTGSRQRPTLSNIEYSADTASKKIWLTAISEFGCIDSIWHPITIEPDITVFIPNAFRPDGNNNEQYSFAPCPDPSDQDCNRVFKVSANGHLSIEIFVFNRWGRQVFHTTNALEGWNGRIDQKGELCPQDVYVYQVNATSYSGKQYRYSGSVTLLR